MWQEDAREVKRIESNVCLYVGASVCMRRRGGIKSEKTILAFYVNSPAQLPLPECRREISGCKRKDVSCLFA